MKHIVLCKMMTITCANIYEQKIGISYAWKHLKKY